MPSVPLPQVDLQAGAMPGFQPPAAIEQRPAVETIQQQQMAEAVGRFGVSVMQIASGLQEQLDEGRSKEGYVELAKHSTEVLENPETGYLNRQGADANGKARQAALDNIDRKREEISKGLDNPEQRGRFKEAADRYMLGVQRAVYTHEATQTHKFLEERSEAMAAQASIDAVSARLLEPPPGAEGASIELAVGAKLRAIAEGRRQPPGAPTDPLVVGGPNAEGQEPQGQEPSPKSQFQLQKDTAIAEANKVATMRGWPPDDPRRAALVRGYTTDIHAGVVRGFLNRNRYQDARSYFTAIPSSEIDPVKQAELGAAVERATIKEDGARIALEAMKGDEVLRFESPNMNAPGEGARYTRYLFGVEAANQRRYATAVERVQSAFASGAIDADRRESALAVLKHDEDARLEAQRLEGVAVVNESIARVSQPGTTLNSIEPWTRSRLQFFGKEQEVARYINNGRAIVTEPAKLLEVTALHDAGLLKDVSLSEMHTRYGAVLSPEDFKYALHLHAEAVGKGTPEGAYAIPIKQLVIGTAISIGIEVPKTNDSNEVKWAWLNFQEKMQTRIQTFEQTVLQGKRKASYEEVKKLCEEAALDRVQVMGELGIWPFNDATRSVFALPDDNPMTPDVNEGSERLKAFTGFGRIGESGSREYRRVFVGAFGKTPDESKEVEQAITRILLNNYADRRKLGDESAHLPTQAEIASYWINELQGDAANLDKPVQIKGAPWTVQK